MPSAPTRILIVEDDAGLAELFSDLLTQDGALCTHVESARLCLDWLATQQADLLLIDYSLPDLLAPALVEALRDAGRLRPFIVVTGHGDERVAVAMMKLGARDYLVKDSLVLDRLPSVVKRTLQELENERRLAATEAALRTETQRADQYFENAAVMMLVLDCAGRVQRINRAGCEILGLPPSEVLGHDWFECFIPSKTHAHVREMFQRLLAGQLDLDRHAENPVLNRAGQERLLAWHNSLIRDATGAITGVLGSAEDITDRHQAEAAQREHESFRKRIFESSQIPIIVMEAHSYRYIDCNPAAVAIYHCASRSELLGHTPMDFSAPVQYDGTPASIKARFYIERSLAEGRVVFEWLHQRADGELWDGEVQLMSFTSNDRRFLQFTVQDVTERRRAAAALRENKERFASAFRNSPISTTIRDLETGRYLEANERCVALLGYARDEIIGHTSADIGWMTEADREENLRLLKAQGNVVDRELRLRRKDGTSAICSYSAHVIPMSGRTCVFSTMVDITARHLAEEQLRLKMEELERSTAELQARNEELTRFNRVATDRELRMIELKQEINDLCRQAGQAPRYPLAFLEPGAAPARAEAPLPS